MQVHKTILKIHDGSTLPFPIISIRCTFSICRSAKQKAPSPGQITTAHLTTMWFFVIILVFFKLSLIVKI